MNVTEPFPVETRIIKEHFIEPPAIPQILAFPTFLQDQPTFSAHVKDIVSRIARCAYFLRLIPYRTGYIGIISCSGKRGATCPGMLVLGICRP